MKIKTITCHDVYNTGASLQAYALATYLNNLGHEVQIINYKPEYLSRHFKLWGLVNPAYDKPVLRLAYNCAKLPGRLAARAGKRKREFDKFTALLPLTAKCYHSYEELQSDPPEADLYIAGSDQIWNTVFQNGRDPAFYLDFAPQGTRKISYAASFSTEDVLESWKPQVSAWLSRLDQISVREKSGVEIVKRLSGQDAVHVLDPVFLLSAEKWAEFAEPIINEEPYLLVYDFDDNPHIAEFAKGYVEHKKLKIYSVLPCSYADRSFEKEGPQVFLSLIKNADYIISNSFHATAYALIFCKEFVVFERNESINTRLYDLLVSLGLSDHMVRSGSELKCGIDYSCVVPLINIQTEQSKRFLDANLVGKLDD